MVERLLSNTVNAIPEGIQLSAKQREELISKLSTSKDSVDVGLRASFFALGEMALAVQTGLLENKCVDPLRLRDVSDAIYFGLDLIRHEIGNDWAGYAHTAAEPLTYIETWFLLTIAEPERAVWLGRHLFNFFRVGHIDKVLRDNVFCDFVWLLIKSSVTGRWETPSTPNRLREYAKLYESVNSPEDFAKAVYDVCDYRLARAWGYQGFFEGAGKLEDGVDMDALGNVHEFAWFGLVPAELLAFAAVYRQTTGNQVSLVCDHPMIQHALLSISDITQIPESNLGKHLDAFGRDIFGKQWKPGALVDLLPPECP